MTGAGGHADEIATLTQSHVNFARGAQVEHPGSLDEKAHFVVVMSVLVEELAA